jgi:hypothetical protein
MKLFAVYIGGEHPRANIELHDMRFVVARTITETYDELRRQWWGTPQSLHIDAWAEISHADGYDVELVTEPVAGKQRLYYVNLGGYDTEEFIEKHRNVFVVAETKAEAKSRALTQNRGWKQLHRDEQYEAEQIFGLADVARQQRLNIQLQPSAAPRPLTFSCKYTRLRDV